MWYLRRLEAGLFTLQTVGYILAWVAMEDDGVSVLGTFCSHDLIVVSPQIRSHLQQMLSRRNKSLQDIADVLQIYHDNIDEDTDAGPDGALSRKEILRNLLAFLR